MLAPALLKIGIEYQQATVETFAGHPLADFIRNDARQALENTAVVRGSGLICKGSAGTGNFAEVPWLALFDPLETTTAREGCYLVYLYAVTGDLYLSLNQGTTGVRREFGSSARDVLNERAALIRARLPEYCDRLPVRSIDLGSAHSLPRDYEAGHALGYRYSAFSPPSEEQLISDLDNAIAAYRALLFRGGLDSSPEASTRVDEDGETAPLSLQETRRYRFHKRIERNRNNSAYVKLIRGTKCEVCEFEFEGCYGELGEGYIEAHHLQPVSSLEEGVTVALDPEKDFAVLCSNCHRMIHRLEDPSDLERLRILVGAAKANRKN